MSEYILFSGVDETKEDIQNLIATNENAGVVIQIKRAAENKDVKTFKQMLDHIKGVIRLQSQIKIHESNLEGLYEEIADERREIKRKKNLVKNGLNFHKVKRGAE